MIVGVPREIAVGERRVALVPAAVAKLLARGVELHVEAGAGAASGSADAAYQEAGATLQSDAATVLGADLVTKVQPPTLDECALLRPGASLVCVLQPYANLDVVKALCRRRPCNSERPRVHRRLWPQRESPHRI